MDDFRQNSTESVAQKPNNKEILLISESTSGEPASTPSKKKSKQPKKPKKVKEREEVVIEIPRREPFTGPFTCSSLPPEIWIQIFTYGLLNPPSFLILLWVCHDFKKIILSDAFLKTVQKKIQQKRNVILAGTPTKQWLFDSTIWKKEDGFFPSDFQCEIYFEPKFKKNQTDMILSLKDLATRQNHSNFQYKVFYKEKIFRIGFSPFDEVDDTKLSSELNKMIFFYQKENDGSVKRRVKGNQKISEFKKELSKRKKINEFIFFIDLEKERENEKDVWPDDFLKNNYPEGKVYWWDEKK